MIQQVIQFKFRIFCNFLNQLITNFRQKLLFFANNVKNADISKNSNGTRRKFQNKNYKDVIFLCFKSHISMFYQLGDAMQQGSCYLHLISNIC